MCLDVITTDELGPISSFLDQGTCKYALLPQLDDGLEDTEATVQDDHIPLQRTNMNPGHVNLFVQMLMLLSRQFIYPGTKISTMFTPHVSTICQISQNLSRNVGGIASVKDRADKMVLKCFLLIQMPR